MWSLGCILIELHTGKPLFDGVDEYDQLMKQIAVLGMPPRSMLDKNKKAEKFFMQDQYGNWTIKRKTKNQVVQSHRCCCLLTLFCSSDRT